MVQQLREKRRRERLKKRREMVINAIALILFFIMAVVGTELMFRAWEKEADLRIKANQEWQMKWNR